MMKWKNKIYVFDDVIPKNKQLDIEDRWLSAIPWYFIKDVTSGNKSKSPRPAFAHPLITNGQQKTSDKNKQLLDQLLQACIDRLFQEESIKANFYVMQSRTFLQMPLNNLSGHEYDQHHIDTHQPHLSVLYYVTDSDGETVLFEQSYKPLLESPNMDEALRQKPAIKDLTEKQRVKPIRGRVVIFDGYRWHTATQPKEKVRCVINTNLMEISV